jgi:hypothetical protein
VTRRVHATGRLHAAISLLCAAPIVASLVTEDGVLWLLVGLATLSLEFPIVLLLVFVARRSNRTFSAVWFVDLDQQLLADREAFVDDTNDNPTVR